MTGPNKPTFWEITTGRGQGFRSPEKIIDDASQYLQYGDEKGEKKPEKLMEFYNEILALLNVDHSDLDHALHAEILSLLALDCAFTLNDEERMSYAHECIHHCDKVYYMDPKSQAISEICRSMKALVDALQIKKSKEKAEKTQAEINKAKGDSGDGKKGLEIPVRINKDKGVGESGHKGG